MQTVQQQLKGQDKSILIDYELVKINDYKSHSFYTFSGLEDFAKMLNPEYARKQNKANNCNDIL